MIVICSSSRTYMSHHKEVSVVYTQGFWDGELGNDVVYFPTLYTPQVRCDIAVIKTSHNFYMNDSHWQVCQFHTAWAGIVTCSLYQHAGIVAESGPW